jgi:hypothetical protein
MPSLKSSCDQMDAKNAPSTENNWRDRDRSPYFHARYTTLLQSDLGNRLLFIFSCNSILFSCKLLIFLLFAFPSPCKRERELKTKKYWFDWSLHAHSHAPFRLGLIGSVEYFGRDSSFTSGGENSPGGASSLESTRTGKVPVTGLLSFRIAGVWIAASVKSRQLRG